MSEIKSIHQIPLPAKPWGQAYDATRGQLAVACFSETENQLEVLIIDLTKEIVVESLSFDFSDVQMLLAFHNGVLVMASYNDENVEIEKVAGYHVARNEWEWQVAGLAFEGMSDTGSLLFKDLKTQALYFLNAEGETAALLSPVEYAEPFITKPVLYVEESEHFKTVAQFLKEKYTISVCEHIEYLEAAGLIIISYYLHEDTGLSNFLLILDEYGEELHREKLAGKLPGVGLESFYFLANHVVSVDQNRNLNLIRI